MCKEEKNVEKEKLDEKIITPSQEITIKLEQLNLDSKPGSPSFHNLTLKQGINEKKYPQLYHKFEA